MIQARYTKQGILLMMITSGCSDSIFNSIIGDLMYYYSDMMQDYKTSKQ